MENDFMNDVASAVDNGGSLPAAVETVVNTTTTAPTVQPIKPNEKVTENVEDRLTKMFDETAQTTIGEKKEETTKEKVKEPVKKPETKEKPARKGQEKLLDTFLKEDDKGNLTTEDGTIIALAGQSRTFYEGMKREARKQREAATDMAVAHMELANKFKSLYDEYKQGAGAAADPVQSIVKETGFGEKEAKTTLAIMQLYKKDPIAGIKMMLTEAQMSGIDISKIGANISVDPATIRSSIKELLDEQLSPLAERAAQDTAQQNAQKEATRFLSEYPEARPFVKDIVKAKEAFPQMPLPEIWLRIRRELEKRSPNNIQQPSTKLRNKVPTEQATKKVEVPSRNYATMSFEEIANSIKQDNKQ
jgi:hypothetical protein